MKFLTLAVALVLTVAMTACSHKHGKDEVGHDKEHQHVTGETLDHHHEEGHHQDHDHKAHHPDHVDTKTTKKKTTSKKK